MLTKEQIERARRAIESGSTFAEIAKRFGVSTWALGAAGIRAPRKARKKKAPRKPVGTGWRGWSFKA
jgi:hypothetical protein